MTKITIKMTILSIIIMLLIVPFASCTSNIEKPSETTKVSSVSTTSTTTTSTTSTTTAPLKLAEVVFWSNWAFPKDVDMVLAQIEEKTRGTLNVDFVFNSAPAGEFINKLNMLYAAGDDFDFQFDGLWLGSVDRASKGYYLDLSELAPQYAPNWIERLTDDELNALKFDGKLVSLGWSYPKSDRVVYLMRKDLADKYKITDIKNFDDVDKALKTLKENESILPIAFDPVGTTNPLSTMFRGASSEYYYALQSAGILYNLKDPKKLVMEYDAQGVKETLTRMNNWYKNGYIDQNILNNKNFTYDQVIAGKAASYLHVYTSLAVNSLLVSSSIPNSGGLVGWNLYPENRASVSGPTNNMFSFNRNSKNPQRALMFLNWVLESQENFDLMIYGIKGVHYELEGNKVKMPSGVSAQTNGWMGWKGQWPFWDLKLCRWNTADTDQYISGFTASASLNTVILPFNGFNFVPTNTQKTTITKYNSLQSEMWNSLACGILSPEKLAEYKQKADALGMPELLAQVQIEATKFLATK